MEWFSLFHYLRMNDDVAVYKKKNLVFTLIAAIHFFVFTLKK